MSTAYKTKKYCGEWKIHKQDQYKEQSSEYWFSKYGTPSEDHTHSPVVPVLVRQAG